MHGVFTPGAAIFSFVRKQISGFAMLRAERF